jgi:hypothetical protein
MTDAQVITAITNIADGTPNSALEIRTLLTELFNRSYKTGDVMMVSCSNAYITANFDGTGLGINERSGWAICNGNNLTRNYNGRVPLAYGVDYTTMGAQDGSKNAVIVEHEHLLFSGANAATLNYLTPTTSPVDNSDGTGWGDEAYRIRGGSTPTLGKSSKIGVSGIDKNMQPYTVTLFIQKINV